MCEPREAEQVEAGEAERTEPPQPQSPALEAQRVYTHRHGDHYTLLGHLVEYDPALLEYAAHPKLVPLVEEIVGGAVRLEGLAAPGSIC